MIRFVETTLVKVPKTQRGTCPEFTWWLHLVGSGYILKLVPA